MGLITKIFLTVHINLKGKKSFQSPFSKKISEFINLMGIVRRHNRAVLERDITAFKVKFLPATMKYSSHDMSTNLEVVGMCSSLHYFLQFIMNI